MGPKVEGSRIKTETPSLAICGLNDCGLLTKALGCILIPTTCTKENLT